MRQKQGPGDTRERALSISQSFHIVSYLHNTDTIRHHKAHPHPHGRIRRTMFRASRLPLGWASTAQLLTSRWARPEKLGVGLRLSSSLDVEQGQRQSQHNMSQSQQIDLGVTADFHVHLREGAMMELVTPTVREGGVSIAYIMPNLVPPVTSMARVTEYREKLQKLAPETTFLMTFYLSRELTPELIHEAAQKKAIAGVKCYPAGVTTNSSAGVDPNDFSDFYPIFKAMEEEDIVLNLHGEKPSSDKEGEEIHVLNAEECFLPALRKLHNDFPNLRIVLEHCTTKAAIDIIDEINKDTKEDFKVAASITAHHLTLTVDSWAGNPINFCKPVAKLPQDRRALVQAATSGKPYFFFGSDSAPHPLHTKSTHIGVCAGVFSQSKAIPYLAQVFESVGKLDNLKSFVNDFGKAFYKVSDDDVVCKDHCILVRKEQTIEETITKGDLVVAPFKPGQKLNFSTEWKTI